MKEKFNWKILDCSKEGWITVEYSNDIYGSVIKSFFIPLWKPKKIIDYIISINIPNSIFLARKNVNMEININSEGSFECDLESEWYDATVEVVDALDLSDETENS